MDNVSFDINILKSFHDKCKENNIWYSLAGTTLLSAKLNKNLIQNNTFEILMKDKDFIVFAQKYKDNIIDSSLFSNFFLLTPFYVEDDNNFIIKINLVIEAEANRVEKNYSIKNLIRQKIGYYKTLKNQELGFWQKIDKLFCKFLGLFWSPLTWEEISSKIYVEKNDGFFIIDSFGPNVNENWLPSLPKEINEIHWNNFILNSLHNEDIYLIKKFGFDWKIQPEIVDNKFNYSFIKNWKKSK